MSKGYVQDFLGLYRDGFFEDIAAYHPTLRRGLERDYIRLMSLSQSMGEKLFTFHLPNLGNRLRETLESGRLLHDGLPLTGRTSGSSMIPRLFSGLWKRIIDKDGVLRQEIDPNDVHFLQALCFAGKKTLDPRKRAGSATLGESLGCSDSAAYATLKEFFDVEAALPRPSSFWDDNGSTVPLHSTLSLTDRVRESGDRDPSMLGDEQREMEASLLDLVQRTADRVSTALGEFNPSEWRFKHGPGAVSDLRRGTQSKYRFPSWPERLEWLFPRDLFATANASLLGEPGRVSEFQGDLFTEDSRLLELRESGRVLPSWEHHSKLILVPKAQKAPRLIAAEPTAHQWCQQSVKDFLDHRIRETPIGKSIDFSRQDLSQALTLKASLSGDYATIDLSSASDRLSCWVVERLFRRNPILLAAFVATRTRYIRNELDAKQPKLVKLRKFASMGSALTFPVQSISFFIMCVAAGLSLHPNMKWSQAVRQVRVYGDDIIVPVEWMPRVEYILSSLYLKVNRSKSFRNGKFRESCGVDAYSGHDVTPTYVPSFYAESVPSTLITTVAVSNNLFLKGLWHAAEWMMSTVPRNIRKNISFVPEGDGSFGFITTSGWRVDARNRYNSLLHRWEAKVFGVKPEDRSPELEGPEALLQYFTSTDRSDLSDREVHIQHLTGRNFGCSVPGIVRSLKLTHKWAPIG